MKVRRYAVALSGLLLLGAMFGCGSASNNDQGVSFLFTGFFSTTSGSALTGLSVPLTSTTGNDTEPGAFGGSITENVGVQNNIAGQGLQVQRLYLSFFIPGASAQPPSTSYGLGVVLGPSGQSDIPSTLPPGYNVPNSATIEVPVVPFEIRSWLAFNKAKLPEPPFVLDVTAYATGITTAGDRLDTNQGLLTVTITPEVPITPGSGDGSGTSSSASSSGAGSVDGSFQ